MQGIYVTAFYYLGHRSAQLGEFVECGELPYGSKGGDESPHSIFSWHLWAER